MKVAKCEQVSRGLVEPLSLELSKTSVQSSEQTQSLLYSDLSTS